MLGSKLIEFIKQRPSQENFRIITHNFVAATAYKLIDLDMSGTFIYVMRCDCPCYLYFNEPTTDGIPLRKGMRLASPFHKAFLKYAYPSGGTWYHPPILQLAVSYEPLFFNQSGLYDESDRVSNWLSKNENFEAAGVGSLVIPTNTVFCEIEPESSNIWLAPSAQTLVASVQSLGFYVPYGTRFYLPKIDYHYIAASLWGDMILSVACSADTDVKIICGV